MINVVTYKSKNTELLNNKDLVEKPEYQEIVSEEFNTADKCNLFPLYIFTY